MPLISKHHFRELQESFFAREGSHSIALIRSHQGGGSVLPRALCDSISGQLHFPLDKVRVHTDEYANRAAAALKAKTFTIENDIFFGSGQFDPQSIRGARLLAHEAVHAVQQSPGTKRTAASEEQLEREARDIAANRQEAPISLCCAVPAILREPTLPRRCTRDALVRETERILALGRDTGSGDETTRMWSRVSSNFGSSTIGVLARRVWTYMFLRHFVDPDGTPGVESIFPRYFFSQRYGWIDGQHFFGFIDYAETQHEANSDDNAAFAAATRQGVQIEERQQSVRDWVIQGAPRDPGTFGLMQVQPPNTPLFRVPQMVVGGAAAQGASLYGSLTLSGTEGELFSQLNEDRRQKFFLDSAKSAFSYEDIPSNQLGIVFYFRYRDAVNCLPPGSIETAFISYLNNFLRQNNVENDQAAVDRQAIASGLPTKERYLAPHATEEQIRSRYPDLFRLPGAVTP